MKIATRSNRRTSANSYHLDEMQTIKLDGLMLEVYPDNDVRRKTLRPGLVFWFSESEIVTIERLIARHREEAQRAHGEPRPVAKSGPIMAECEECHGQGETQASCHDCGVALTHETANADDPDFCDGCAKGCQEHKWIPIVADVKGHKRRHCACGAVEVWAWGKSRRGGWNWRPARNDAERANLRVSKRGNHPARVRRASL